MWIEERNALPVVDVGRAGNVSILCGGASHSAWPDGVHLALDEHDVEAECALLALGAPMPACLVYAWIWQHAFQDEGFIVDWADDADRAGTTRAREDWVGNYWESWPTEPAAARALFGPALQDRLGAACAPRWSQEGYGTPGAEAARRAVQTRARRALVLSLANVTAHRRPDALVPMAIRVTTDAPEPRIAGRLALDGSGVDVVLDIGWLLDVWAKGAAVRDGEFVLARDDDSLTSVVWEPTGGAHLEHAPRVVRR